MITDGHVPGKKHLYQHSPTDYGTLHQLRNLINRCNVVKMPKNYFHACDDYFQLVLQCHVITAATKVLCVEATTSSPSLSNISAHPVEDRKAIMKLYADAIVGGFTNLGLLISDSQTVIL